MKENIGKILGYGVIGQIVLAVLGPCLSTGPPPVDPRVVQHQLELVNTTLDALHEEVAAARSPSSWPFALFIGSILAPLGAGIWLLWRCERSVIGHDAVIRTMIRAGLQESVIRGYAVDAHRRSGTLPASDDRPRLRLAPVQRHARPHRRSRRWRKRRQDEPP